MLNKILSYVPLGRIRKDNKIVAERMEIETKKLGNFLSILFNVTPVKGNILKGKQEGGKLRSITKQGRKKYFFK